MDIELRRLRAENAQLRQDLASCRQQLAALHAALKRQQPYARGAGGFPPPRPPPATRGGGEAPRNRSARCAACYGFCMGNACIFGLVGLLLGVLAFDGFTANEIDYWYPVRPRPRTA